MNKIEKRDFENYLGEARSWETSKVREIERSKKLAWRVTIAFGVTAVAAVLAVAMMMPLKTVEPYVIRVDNSTGIVDVVKALKDGKTNYDEAMNKYFTQWYVRYREGYSKELAEDYYYNVGIMSNTTEQQKYYQYFNPKNPLSPLNVYGAYAKVKISIKSTSFINPTIALVRYTKEIERGLDKPLVTHWAATVTFRYTKAPMSEKDRGINPLGFQVIEYRNDPDALTPAAPALATPPASAPATPSVTVFPRTETSAPAPVVPAIQQ
ncbi:MAG: virB8 family protein [Azoarcus sp.]|jgi:type IV secretion system protein VirB8|nr:virB8 family protein [Azoarcus sp.]